MDGLTATEAAARLGVKRQTIYAYVSRGLLPRRVGPDGRTSLFEPDDLDRLRRGTKDDDGELRTLIATALTRVDDDGLAIRGRPLVDLVADGLDLTGAADLLWDAPPDESWVDAGETTAAAVPAMPGVDGLDELRLITALCSAGDPLRHELAPKSVRAVGRRLMVAMANGLGPRADGVADASVSAPAAALWARLADDGATHDRDPHRPPPARLRALDAAMALLVDHGLAGSTFAARVAASVRADPYAVVGAGLGVLSGPLHGAASSEVHDLLADAQRRGDAAAALGDVRRRLGRFPGVGHSVYRTQDPRYGTLMALIVDAWGDDPRLVHVYRVRDLMSERTDALPNVDLALGALTWLADMPAHAGEVIFAIARTAGWLGHAMEEYGEPPLRFRVRARYVGP
ncbi:MAG: citrate synthase [Actinomycetota bacterium]